MLAEQPDHFQGGSPDQADDWYERWRARLAAGDNAPIPHDPDWWERWAARVANSPDVADAPFPVPAPARQGEDHHPHKEPSR